MKYCFVQDDDGHWYLIPENKKRDFDYNLNEANDRYINAYFGKYRCGNPQHAIFENPEWK